MAARKAADAMVDAADGSACTTTILLMNLVLFSCLLFESMSKVDRRAE